MKKKKLQPVPEDLMRRGDIWMPGPIAIDPMGSYTGRPLDTADIPVQDADDL